MFKKYYIYICFLSVNSFLNLYRNYYIHYLEILEINASEDSQIPQQTDPNNDQKESKNVQTEPKINQTESEGSWVDHQEAFERNSSQHEYSSDHTRMKQSQHKH